jgi:hypothetical protein
MAESFLGCAGDTKIQFSELGVLRPLPSHHHVISDK